MTLREAFARKQRKEHPHMLLPTIDPDARIIWPYVEIGNGVGIGPGCIIGYQGVGYIKEDGSWLHIPQIGRVIIGNEVDIYPGTHIQRGTIDNTIIGARTVIGHNCNIAHNVRIGEDCMLTNAVNLGGSVIIGDNVYIASGVIIKDHVTISDNVHIGQGSNVLEDLTKSGWWYKGNPARLFREVKDGDV